MRMAKTGRFGDNPGLDLSLPEPAFFVGFPAIFVEC
jgi:hypothetical protein